MTKLRIIRKHDKFDGAHYYVQKRVYLFFWITISDGFDRYSDASQELESIERKMKLGVAV